jgi:hypothetical protein
MVRSDRRHTIRDKTNPGRPDLLDNLVGLPSSSKLMSGSRGWSGVSLQARRGVLCSCAGNCVRAMLAVPDFSTGACTLLQSLD